MFFYWDTRWLCSMLRHARLTRVQRAMNKVPLPPPPIPVTRPDAGTVTRGGSHHSSVPAPAGATPETGTSAVGPSQTAFPPPCAKRRDAAALHKACPSVRARPGNLATQQLWARASPVPHLHSTFRFPPGVTQPLAATGFLRARPLATVSRVRRSVTRTQVGARPSLAKNKCHSTQSPQKESRPHSVVGTLIKRSAPPRRCCPSCERRTRRRTRSPCCCPCSSFSARCGYHCCCCCWSMCLCGDAVTGSD